ncbi:IS1182 family transposase ISMgi3 [Mycobacterium heckeshornense]|uniref:transposase n=1 Tax=Mycobacterium heckeshornense TaxID=110505 RepID=UPI0019450CE3|nr:transposase [Mycobacterium heckeshornense]BCQ06724.1 IS1182 family transposase ISMgi3 [Mycobacterium heckeshornense]
MTLGLTPTQADLLRSTAHFCDGRVPPDSIYGVLHRECFALFPDELFADLFTDVGRRSVPPMIVAVVMVLQRIEGLSDREAVDRFAFDARWKYAAGGLDFDYPGFVETVLVDMRARLARSDRPNRIFEVTLEAAKAAGLVGRRRVLDSTPLYDAVATMDTVTLIRSAIRGLLKVADAELEPQLRAVLGRDDDYISAGKPVCDYDDAPAREALVDGLARDAHALPACLQERKLGAETEQAARLLATVVGQDLDRDTDGVFRIARRVAADRVISTVDPDARHGHKTSARGFDGYKGHIAIDPDAEIVTATEVGAANAGDAEPATDLLADDLPEVTDADAGAGDDGDDDPNPDADGAAASESPARSGDGPAVYGDAAYGAGPLLARLETAGAQIFTKVQPPTAPGGRFAKDRFAIDLNAGTVSCPNAVTVPIRPAKIGGGTAVFGAACAACPLAAQCTGSAAGRTIRIGAYEAQLSRARTAQADPAWAAQYKATRPKVERKIAHLMRRRHGGRRARMRGTTKVAADFSLLAAAVNLARLGALGLCRATGQGWQVAPA